MRSLTTPLISRGIRQVTLERKGRSIRQARGSPARSTAMSTPSIDAGASSGRFVICRTTPIRSWVILLQRDVPLPPTTRSILRYPLVKMGVKLVRAFRTPGSKPRGSGMSADSLSMPSTKVVKAAAPKSGNSASTSSVGSPSASSRSSTTLPATGEAISSNSVACSIQPSFRPPRPVDCPARTAPTLRTAA